MRHSAGGHFQPRTFHRQRELTADLDLDHALRTAVFQHVGRLQATGGGVVTFAQLNHGIVFRGERVPIWNYQRGIFAPGILGRGRAALSVQTSLQSPYDDRWSPEDDRLVYRYQGEDPNKPDNVMLRRAMELGRPLLYLVAVQKGIYEPIFPCYVVGDEPTLLTFFLLADAEGLVAVGSADDVASFPRKAYITRQVKQRLHQRRFRSLVISAYRTHCAMCRLRHIELLDAAHILPDREERGEPVVPNGLSLCRIHHGAFDVGILGIDPDYRIHIRPDILEEHDGPMLLHGLQELHGGALLVPRRQADRPDRDALAERFATFRAA
jgi:putative restriction endonuclease